MVFQLYFNIIEEGIDINQEFKSRSKHKIYCLYVDSDYLQFIFMNKRGSFAKYDDKNFKAWVNIYI